MTPSGGPGPFDTSIDAAMVDRFRATTGTSSTTVPPMVLACRIFEAQNAGRLACVPDAVQRAAGGGVHGEHDLVVHRPLVAGEELRTSVALHGVRPAGGNVAVTLRFSTVAADDAADVAADDAAEDVAVVAEQWWTTVLFGTTGEPTGQAAPDHRFPDGARDHPVGTHTVDVDADMARRYAEASGDWSPHHFDVEAARSSGFDRPFLHGLCTMALCARAVAAVSGEGDRARLRRVAARFASPMPLGEQLEVAVFDAGAFGLAFEATCRGATVISHGRAELAVDRPETPA